MLALLCERRPKGNRTPSSDQVFREKLRHNHLQISNTDFIDQTIDRFLQRFPCHTLILLARLIRKRLLQSSQLGWWNITSTRFRVEESIIFFLRSSLLLLLSGWLLGPFILALSRALCNWMCVDAFVNRSPTVDTWRRTTTDWRWGSRRWASLSWIIVLLRIAGWWRCRQAHSGEHDVVRVSQCKQRSRQDDDSYRL